MTSRKNKKLKIRKGMYTDDYLGHVIKKHMTKERKKAKKNSILEQHRLSVKSALEGKSVFPFADFGEDRIVKQTSEDITSSITHENADRPLLNAHAHICGNLTVGELTLTLIVPNLSIRQIQEFNEYLENLPKEFEDITEAIAIALRKT